MNAIAEALELARPQRELPMQAFESRYHALLESTQGNANPVVQALRESARAGGKRVRPKLMMHAALDLGLDPSDCLSVAAAVEMIHTASLVFDDLPCMDDALLRRGRPTLHRQYGEDVAILAGIALMMKAFEAVTADISMTPLQRLSVANRLSAVAGLDGLVSGQIRDLRGGESGGTIDDIAATNALKTGSLFTVALESVGIMAGGDDSVMRALRGFSYELGHAFQLADDLKDDSANDPSLYGKDVGKDHGKLTCPRVLGNAHTRSRIKRHVESADGYLQCSDCGFSSARQYLRDLCADMV